MVAGTRSISDVILLLHVGSHFRPWLCLLSQLLLYVRHSFKFHIVLKDTLWISNPNNLRKMASRNSMRPRPISRSKAARPSTAKSTTSPPPSQAAPQKPLSPPWSPWTWEDTQQIYYRALKLPNSSFPLCTLIFTPANTSNR